MTPTHPKIQRTLTWFFLFFLIAIHSADMALTEYYIGNNANFEVFPPMRMTIAALGIHAALWISRIIMYTYYFLALVNMDKKKWFYFLILATILYYTAMLNWVFQLGLANWPFPNHLRAF